MSELVLETRALGYRYEELWALRRVDLPVTRGERLALVGANGSGKTTLLLHLNGTLRPTEGQLRRHGEPARYDRRALSGWRREVALVLQNPDDQLFAATVAKDVSFGPANLGLSAGEIRERVEEALSALGIADLADRPTHQLSFGQKKRVALAGALAMRPTVLLLDEPTSGLDPACEQETRVALEALSARGTTLIIATHDMDLAYEWADSVVVLDAGCVVGRGDPASIFEDGQTLAAARLRVPRLLEIASALSAAGLLPQTRALPRTTAELCRLLAER